MTGKKGQIGNLQSLIIPLVAIGIVLAVGFLILAEVRTQAIEIDTGANCTPSDLTGCGYAYNGTVTTTNALQEIPGWLPIIIITIIGALLIGLVALFRGR